MKVSKMQSPSSTKLWSLLRPAQCLTPLPLLRIYMHEERTITYSAALNEALREEMQRDSSVFVMGEEVSVWGEGGGVFGVTKGLSREFGSARVRNTPISEEGIVALGGGPAVTGMMPITELMYGDFLTLAMEPLVNQAAKLRYMFGGQAQVPLVLRTN